jgi:hypothetical protein
MSRNTSATATAPVTGAGERLSLRLRSVSHIFLFCVRDDGLGRGGKNRERERGKKLIYNIGARFEFGVWCRGGGDGGFCLIFLV